MINQLKWRINFLITHVMWIYRLNFWSGPPLCLTCHMYTHIYSSYFTLKLNSYSVYIISSTYCSYSYVTHGNRITMSLTTHTHTRVCMYEFSIVKMVYIWIVQTDTASVLHEALGYIRFLHDQVQVLCSPYLHRSSSHTSLTVGVRLVSYNLFARILAKL